MRVFVLSSDRKPLDPCEPARARELLSEGRAAVFKRFPFTIILKNRTEAESVTHPCRAKVDPGSKVTGLAVVQEQTGRVVFAAEIEHRGRKVKAAMDARRILRRGRRSRKTRYRAQRFDNRTRRPGWLPPSLESRVANVQTWVGRVSRFCPVQSISMELVRFDFQKMENPEVGGVEYQRGTLHGFEVKEYLLLKFGHKCAYCGAEGVPLQIEHVRPKGQGGTDRVSNLALACGPCNQEKGNRTAAEYGHPQVEAQAKRPLKDAAAVNTTRWELFHRLQATGLPVECGSGGRTKFNRVERGLSKEHWIDAACVGVSTPAALRLRGVRPLRAAAFGHGKRQRCVTNKYGFPKGHAPRAKSFMGFQTGDIVRAVIPGGRHAGRNEGRLVIRFRPQFQIGEINAHPKYLTALHRADGYGYTERNKGNSSVA